MPFSDTKHRVNGKEVSITAAEWTHIYTQWIKRAVESFENYGFQCARSPALPGNFIKGIVKDLYEADLVIADLTGSRSNVYYELGIRHGLETGTVMITQHLDSIPSDLRGYYCFQYDYAPEAHLYEASYRAFATQLHEKMLHFFQNAAVSDNPVSDFLGYRNAFLQERFELEKRELRFLAESFRALELESYEKCEDLLKSLENESHEMTTAFVFDFALFDAVLFRFIGTRWELLPEDTLQNFFSFIQSVRTPFLRVYQDLQAIRINPRWFLAPHFLDLVKSVVAQRDEEQRMFKLVIESLDTISMSVTHKPKSFAAKKG